MIPGDPRLPSLPLVLCGVPPAVAMGLAQEGVPTVAADRSGLGPLPARGRFVLFDGQRTSPRRLAGRLAPGQVALDVDRYRSAERIDPFAALVDLSGGPVAWSVGGLRVVEAMNRHDRAALRCRWVDRLRRDVTAAGGVWARLAAFPSPYRSAFNLRIDLDEPDPADYARFAVARRPIDSATTHFVSTAAYGRLPGVLADLRRVDAQSHGHFHHVYRDEVSNHRNLARAHAILTEAGFPTPEGFAGPHGRWNRGVDRVLEGLGYRYSSDFQLGWDDRPFFPWLGDRFSNVLQVPVHPLCEGAFFEAGGTPADVAEHLVGVVRRAIDAGEPAFVYGHPEGRLGRYPAIVATLADAVAGEDLVWRTTLTEFARWWRWRGEQRWSLDVDETGGMTVRVDGPAPGLRYPLALEIVRGHHVATVPITAPSLRFRREALVFERRGSGADHRVDQPGLSAIRPPLSLRRAVRSALDWEKVTPVDEIDPTTFGGRLKRSIRRWRS